MQTICIGTTYNDKYASNTNILTKQCITIIHTILIVIYVRVKLA